MAIDSTGNLWFASYYNDELSEFSSSGQIVSGSPFFSGGIYPIAMAIDTSVNLWLANQGDSLSELSSAGHAASGSPFRGAGLNSPAAIAIDDSGNVWVANQAGNSLSEFNSSGQAAAGSPFSGGGLASPDAIAIDGSGNIWAADDVPTPPPSSPSSSCCLSEFNSSGTAISPPSGYQAGELNGAGPIAIDGSGNIWVVNGLDALEFVGLATPVVTPIVANLLSPYGQYAVNKP
jgi:DNA-binding beta-propeller fold protein YncE